MKRVLHVIDHLDLGGAQSVLLDLVTLIDRSQWSCEVAVMHGRGLFAELLEERGITVHTLSPSLWPPRYLAAFTQLQERFDLFHFHLSGANAIAKPLAAMLGDQPRIAHDHASADLRFRGKALLLLDAMMHGFSSHTVAVSSEVKQFLIQYEARPAESITVIPNGVNVDQFRPCSSQEKQEARRFFGWREKDYIIGTVGRLAPEKNQRLLLQAAKQALEQGLSAIFVIAGTGPEEAALRTFVEQQGLSASIQFLGQVQERILLYRALDCFVLTSLYEGLPMALLEAMASGIPVMSTDLEGIHHALEGGRHGHLFPSGASKDLASLLLHQKDDQCSGVEQQQIQSARQKVASDFSAQHSIRMLEKLYEYSLTRSM